jgi:hypothetical protein
MLEVIAVARDEARAGTVDFEEGAKSVVFQLEEPAIVVEGGGAPFHYKWHDLWSSGRH